MTLPSALLAEIDRRRQRSRSAFLEEAATLYLAQQAQRERDAKDLAIYAAHSERLNREAADDSAGFGFSDFKDRG